MSTSVETFDRLAAVLAEVRPRLGAAGFAEKRRVIALLSDKAPDAKREIRAIGVAIDEGVPTALARTERHLLGVEMDRLVNALEEDTGIRAELARHVVRAFAFALDLGPPPSIYESGSSAAMPPTPATAPGGDHWAGLSASIASPAANPPAPVQSAPAAPGYPPTHSPAPPPMQAHGAAPYVPPAHQTGPYSPPPPAYYGGAQAPPAYPYPMAPPRKMTGGRIALLVVGGLVILGGLARMVDGGRRASGGSSPAAAMAAWTCPRIADKSIEMSQQQPIHLRTVTNVRETGRTSRDAHCQGFASTESGETGDIYMRAYVEGGNIMVAYQGEPFPN